MRYIVSSRSAVPPSGGFGQVDQSRHSDRDAPITVTYNKDNQVIAEKNSKTGDKIKYVYDDNGNLIEKKTKGKSTVYSYDTENRLRSVTKGGQILLAATYDGDGNKVFQMTRKYVDGTKQISKKKKVKTATIQAADDDSDGDGSDQNAETKKAKVPTVKENFDPDIFWYGGAQGIMKLTAGQCPALLTAIGKEIRDLWHGFKTFVTGDYTEIDMGQNVGKTAEEKNGDTLTANEMATIVVPGTERATLVTWDITNYLNDTNFNENAQVMYQYDQDGKEKASYVYGETDSRISGDLTKEAVKYTEQKAGDYSYLYDGQGNVINTVRNGSVAESYNYDPFGEMTAEGKEGTSKTPLEAQNDNGLSDNDVLWGYNEEEYIEEVGLQYLRQRHYSPETGNFTSQDTNEGDLTNPLSQNRYIYAENDPVNGNDPGGDKKKTKKTSTKKTNKKTTKSSSKSSKKTSKKTNKKTTSKKSASKKKANSKKSSSKKTSKKKNSGSLWSRLKSKAKKYAKKGWQGLKDKASALKKSVTCKKKKSNLSNKMLLTSQYNGYVKNNSKSSKNKFLKQKHNSTYFSKKAKKLWNNASKRADKAWNKGGVYNWANYLSLGLVGSGKNLINYNASNWKKVKKKSSLYNIGNYLTMGTFDMAKTYFTSEPGSEEWFDSYFGIGAMMLGGKIAANKGGLTAKKGFSFGKNKNSSKVILTNNAGRNIDITPARNHGVTSGKGDLIGKPNSSIDILDKQGNLKTRRWYDKDGRAYRDVDMTNHGNSKMHPEYPHEHKWVWSNNNPRRI